MKRATRILSSILVSALLLCSLCGCNYIDKARRNQAFKDIDGTITYNGYEYKYCINVNEYFDPHMKYDYIYITEPDVPVLLSSLLGEASDISYDGAVIAKGSGGYYIRTDIYDAVLEEMSDPVMNSMYYFKLEINNQGFPTGYTPIKLTDEETEAILNVAKGEPVEAAHSSFEYSLNISIYSEDLYFYSHSFYIATIDSAAYIYFYKDGERIFYKAQEEYEKILTTCVKRLQEETDY